MVFILINIIIIIDIIVIVIVNIIISKKKKKLHDYEKYFELWKKTWSHSAVHIKYAIFY